jgi:hypothetical protein
MTAEVRVTDPTTGGQKGRKDVELMSLLRMAPLEFLTDLGRVYEMGARKYDEDNWRRGYAWSLTLNAALRHLAAAIKGEWRDPESGLPHVVHVAWHMATLHTFEREGLGTDDRTPRKDPQKCPESSLSTPTSSTDSLTKELEAAFAARWSSSPLKPSPKTSESSSTPCSGSPAPPPPAGSASEPSPSASASPAPKSTSGSGSPSKLSETSSPPEWRPEFRVDL